jgi:predicted dehydrogenase
MKKVRIGYIGCGKIVQASHLPAMIAEKGRAQIVALHDLKPETAEKAKADFGLGKAVVHLSMESLLKSDVDAVIISTPNTLHYPQTMAALKAGKHVLVEKPMAVDMKQADAMIAEAKKQKRILQVNQTLRFHATYAKIKELVDSGAIGDPVHIRCLRAGGSSPDQGWSPGASWFVQKKFRGGLIMDIAVHMADIMGWYFGKADMIYAVNTIRKENGEVPDNVSVLIHFANNATGILELSWTIPCGGGLLEIYGSKGTIRLGFGGKGLEMAKAGGEYKEVKTKKVKNSHQVFLDAISGKGKCADPGEVGRHALSYCLAIEKAGDTGRAAGLN